MTKRLELKVKYFLTVPMKMIRKSHFKRRNTFNLTFCRVFQIMEISTSKGIRNKVLLTKTKAKTKKIMGKISITKSGKISVSVHVSCVSCKVCLSAVCHFRSFDHLCYLLFVLLKIQLTMHF